MPDRPDPIRLSRKDPALQLIQRVRDEAHRFADHAGIAGVEASACGRRA